MPRNLILVRHGQSEANVIQTCRQGRRPGAVQRRDDAGGRPLLAAHRPAGVAQARAAGRSGSRTTMSTPLDRCITSPYVRTRETAANLGLEGCPVGGEPGGPGAVVGRGLPAAAQGLRGAVRPQRPAEDGRIPCTGHRRRESRSRTSPRTGSATCSAPCTGNPASRTSSWSPTGTSCGPPAWSSSGGATRSSWRYDQDPGDDHLQLHGAPLLTRIIPDDRGGRPLDAVGPYRRTHVLRSGPRVSVAHGRAVPGSDSTATTSAMRNCWRWPRSRRACCRSKRSGPARHSAVLDVEGMEETVLRGADLRCHGVRHHV
jgi:hypothetical protein